MKQRWALVDERDGHGLRRRIGSHLEGAETVDFAVDRIRLAALDLTADELAGDGRWRVLLGHLDAATLLDAVDPPGPGTAAVALGRLREFAGSGRLAVRSAGLGSWTPDFAVIRSRQGAVCVVGAIYFGSPRLLAGPSLTALTDDAASVARVAARFDELWARSHDVLPAIVNVLERAHDATLAATAASRSAGNG